MAKNGGKTMEDFAGKPWWFEVEIVN
jgi:hypothetical protein